jgi:hypothetical protein
LNVIEPGMLKPGRHCTAAAGVCSIWLMPIGVMRTSRCSRMAILLFSGAFRKFDLLGSFVWSLVENSLLDGDAFARARVGK